MVFTLESKDKIIADIRQASREMVRELGFMQSTLAATDYSASAVHALIEIDEKQQVTSAQLAQFLGLEKSSISRMIAKLLQAGELQESIAEEDARVKYLKLTEKGRETVAQIHDFGKMQVSAALQYLNPGLQQSVAQGLQAYAVALKQYRTQAHSQQHHSIEICTGYQAGMIGRITEMHAQYYSQTSNFGQYFESLVAHGIAEFSGRLEHAVNQIWTAKLNQRIVGSVAIDGQDLGGNIAHLRWFILDDGCRGHGVGHQLLQQAIEHCDEQQFREIHLWTFKGLNAARKLYERFGFQLVEEVEGQQWGNQVVEQKFVRFAS
ncbi:GNAT family N-acetyltransferase [Acinetobacter chinensis]|uniref:GNAT family N-acetyltransferase n=1 Tax=Acinetobacter chinensis TaxID=2004650 RepID=A0A3B7LX13_9GAMM|nr:bifunctional helix-turn-helix transcriptional regulator/GNAT family N-acetyltransferase [Acinetobacter chinensis]AXY57322.1 GNAT family N-acetyltransferase [Acinetobacter chinensis]